MRRTPIRKISAKRQAQIIKEKELALKLYLKQDGKCAECGKIPDWRGFQLSHTRAKSHGGESSLENCQLLCGKCHGLKHGIFEK